MMMNAHRQPTKVFDINMRRGRIPTTRVCGETSQSCFSQEFHLRCANSDLGLWMIP